MPHLDGLKKDLMHKLQENVNKEKRIEDLQNLLMSLKIHAVKLKKQTEDDSLRLEDLEQENMNLKSSIEEYKTIQESMENRSAEDKSKISLLENKLSEFKASSVLLYDEMRTKCREFETRMGSKEKENTTLQEAMKMQSEADTLRIQHLEEESGALKELLEQHNKQHEIEMDSQNKYYQHHMKNVENQLKQDEKRIISLERQNKEERLIIENLENENTTLKESLNQKHLAIEHQKNLYDEEINNRNRDKIEMDELQKQADEDKKRIKSIEEELLSLVQRKSQGDQISLSKIEGLEQGG